MDTKLERSQILLTPDQRRALEEIARRTGSSVSGVIRQAIDDYLAGQEQEQQRRIAHWGKEQQFIHSLEERGPAYGGRTWKREDLYDD